jgi:peptide/nickel transport system substrate-binding protein
MTRRDPLHRTFRVTVAAAAALLAVTLVPAASATASVHPRALPTSVTVGEYPGEAPSYIFPFTPCPHYDVANVQDFQELMYRPLYWFGLGASRTEQPALSLANQPVFTGTSVALKLKGWKFADGSPVNAGSVEFFINLWKAEAGNFCGTSAGTGIPGQVASVSGAPSGSTVVIQFKGLNLASTSVDRWLLDDYLSQITPLPKAWDVAGGCAAPGFSSSTTLAACASDWATLNTRANDFTTYGGAFWNAGADGPYRLSSYGAGSAKLVPNPTYSGPQKAQLTVIELPYASMSAELADLQASNLQIGYVDPSSLPAPAPTAGKVGPNLSVLSAHYLLEANTVWGYDSVLYNYGSADPMAPVLSQAYVRAAITGAVNGPGIIANVFKGYAYPNCSSNPPLVDASLSSAVACAYPFSAAKAKALLESNGWTLSGGVMTCTSPGTATGQCGAGIQPGQTLGLDLEYSAGVPSVTQAVNVLVSELNAIGVQLTTHSATYDNVYQQCGGSAFQLCWWDGGQLYSRSVYPAGDAIYATGGQANLGGYSSSALNGTITASHTSMLTKYAQLVAKDAPSLFMPDRVLTTEVSRSLLFTNAAASAPNPYQDFNPEYMTYTATVAPVPTCKGTGTCDVAAASPQVICLTVIGCSVPGGGGGGGAHAAGPCGTLNTTTTCVGVKAYVNGHPVTGKLVTVHFLSPSVGGSTTGSWCEPQGSHLLTTFSGRTGVNGTFYFPYTTTGLVQVAGISSFCVMRAIVGRASNIMAIDETNDPGPYRIAATPRQFSRPATTGYRGRGPVFGFVNDPTKPAPNGVNADPTTIISEIPSTVGACGYISPYVRKTGTTGHVTLSYHASTVYGTKLHPVTCRIIAQEAVTSAKSRTVTIIQTKP